MGWNAMDAEAFHCRNRTDDNSKHALISDAECILISDSSVNWITLNGQFSPLGASALRF
jgi:hypothetical protein